MNLPKFNETFTPILEILSNGESIHHRELIKRVQQQYYSHLPDELLKQQTKSGEVLIENRIAWGKSTFKPSDTPITRYAKAISETSSVQ